MSFEFRYAAVAVLDQHAWALLRRLTRWLDQFKDCFGHRAQHVSLRQYVDGLLSDSARKSMSAMLARDQRADVVPSVPTLHHARAVGRRGRVAAIAGVIPERTGILILDETSFPKSGPHSVGVGAAGPAGRWARWPIAKSRSPLRSGPEPASVAHGGLALSARGVDERCDAPGRGRIPDAVAFQEKWRLALTLVRRTRAAGITLTAVVADAEYGDNSTVRQTLHRLGLPYALGISPTLTVFRGTPTLRVDRDATAAAQSARGVARSGACQRPRAQRRAADARAGGASPWRNGTNPPVGSRLRGAARHAGDRLAPATPRPRGVAAVRTRPRSRRGGADTTWSRCRRRPR